MVEAGQDSSGSASFSPASAIAPGATETAIVYAVGSPACERYSLTPVATTARVPAIGADRDLTVGIGDSKRFGVRVATPTALSPMPSVGENAVEKTRACIAAPSARTALSGYLETTLVRTGEVLDR